MKFKLLCSVVLIVVPSLPLRASFFGIQTHQGHYVSPRNDDSFQQSERLGVWEQFEFITYDAQGRYLGDNLGYLRSQKGVYISVQGDEVQQQLRPGAWEIFERIYLADGKVAFRNVHFDTYLSFDGKLFPAHHLKHWEAFWLYWQDKHQLPSTSVYLIEGNIGIFPPAKHGGLLFVNNHGTDRETGVVSIEVHFRNKNYFFGGDALVVGTMELLHRKSKKLGEVPLTIWEAQNWVVEWAKSKHYRLSTFNCWKLPMAFSKRFGLLDVDEPIQNDLLIFTGATLTLPLYAILTGRKKI